jgi:hypothetical protein
MLVSMTMLAKSKALWVLGGVLGAIGGAFLGAPVGSNNHVRGAALGLALGAALVGGFGDAYLEQRACGMRLN